MTHQLNIEENISLSGYTTFKVGGPARYFVRVRTIDELQAALSQARENSWPILVLAGGSNLIITDKGFNGLVIYVQFMNYQIDGQLLTSGAATEMKTLVDASVEAGLAGIEWAGGLPGSLGGAIRGNAGAFGGEIKDVVQSVTSVEMQTGKINTRNNQECHFIYRGSYYKETSNEVIVAAELKLIPGNKTELREIADSRIRYRQERHPMEYPSAGSIFKNTPVEHVPAEHLKHFEMSIKNDPFPVVPTAKIIALSELAGLRVGGAELSTKHTNYIVNVGNASAQDVYDLIQLIKQKVKERFGISLEVEPELVGF